MVNVVLVDDHQLVLDGLKAILSSVSINIAGEGNSIEELKNILPGASVQVLLLDLNLPGESGLDAIPWLKKNYPALKIIALTMHHEPHYVQYLSEAGIAGYVLKSADKHELLTAINSVAQGQTYWCVQALSALRFRPQVADVKITRREMQVLKLLAQSLTTSEIAEKLCISHFTVDTHRKNLLSKLDVKNTAGLIRYALDHNLIL